jgi:ArsR family transcriptional regulator
MKDEMVKKILLDEEKQREVHYYMPEDDILSSLANFFSIFSDTTRIKILSALAVSEMCVNDIANLLELNQTTVSHQLKSLKIVGAVKYRRDGKSIFYSIADNMINDTLLSGVNYLMD